MTETTGSESGSEIEELDKLLQDEQILNELEEQLISEPQSLLNKLREESR